MTMTLLFIPMSFWLAIRVDLSRRSRALLWAISGFMLLENTQLALTLNETFHPDTIPALAALGVARCLPILLLFVFYITNREQMITLYGTGGPGSSPELTPIHDSR